MKLLKILGFLPKENSTNIYYKKYLSHNNYIIEIDSLKKTIDFGSKIFFNESKNSIQNITKAEDEVVLECVDRLLEKGYAPQNIVLEKRWEAGHGHSGRLDILVTRDDDSAYMMIECKTWGKEYEKAFAKLQKDGGQLFTYFRFDTKAEILVLYASKLNNDKVEYINQIIKVEEEYRATSNVKDFYDRWNKLSKNNGLFETWVTPYNYKSKALTAKDLVDITANDSSKIFNRFMEILRHNVVSDKPNAFSKIFTLFLCKIMDEKITKPNEELGFQWFEGIDTHISFQKRLTDLYQKGMKAFLDKEVTDLSDIEFEEKFGELDNNLKQQLLEEFTKIRLQKNNEFAIKDVFDQDTFEENAIVVKEVVELLQHYKIRYTKKQQFLSDFFELLLTTGLKQEVGQFFTPVPIAKFIIRSIPFDSVIKEKLEEGTKDELLPNVIDYAVGSGHFITEAMDEIQKNINCISPDEYIFDTAKKLKSWQTDHFDWAYDYVYGIEKDYRLVKTAKVGCYLHGDGLARVIHGDGLSNFTQTKEYKGKLTKRDKNYTQDNKQFDMVLSNPPYSVSAFKNIGKTYNKDDFELYSKLTDQSSEIEALFVERTKQLLKDGGIAGIILPSSILNNSGIYTKTREIIFKYFDIIAITELGSNTFMATNTNTVILFLRRKNNMLHKKIESSIEKLFKTRADITINSVEKPLKEYLANVWKDISVEDYFTLLDGEINEKLSTHEMMKEYMHKLKGNSVEQRSNIIQIEQEKLCYFIMAYSQKVTIVKTGEKKEEKKFLGYEFSNRRGSEGIHPTQRENTIDECTSLYDESSYINPLKANSYIYSAFNGEHKEIDKSLKKNIAYVDLVDMINFNEVSFEKNISLNIKKKIKIDSQWEIVKLDKFIEILDNKRIPLSERDRKEGEYPYYGATGIIDYINDYIFDEQLILIGEDGAKWSANEKSAFIVNGKYWVNNHAHVLRPKRDLLLDNYLIEILNQYDLSEYITGLNVLKLNQTNLKNIKIPLPPKEIQKKIVAKLEALDTKVKSFNIQIDAYKKEIFQIINRNSHNGKVSDLCKISKEKLNPQDFKKKKFCYLGLEHLESNTGKIFSNEELGENIQSTKNKFNKEDVLYGKLRPYLNKVALTSYEGICSTDILVLKSDVPLILKYILLSDKFVEKTSSLMAGVSLPRIKIDTFLNINIEIPPLNEQSEIVAKIKTIENKIAKLEEKLLSIPQEKEKILIKYL